VSFDAESLVETYMRLREEQTPETPERAAGRALWGTRTRGVFDLNRAADQVTRDARHAHGKMLAKSDEEKFKAAIVEYETLCGALRLINELRARRSTRRLI